MKRWARLGLAGWIAAITIPVLRADTSQEKFWTNYIEACSPSSQLNGKAHYLGTTNEVGPGSVWGTAGGTTNLIAPAEQYLGKADGDGKVPMVVYATSTVNCADKGSRTWDFSAGVPLSFASIGSVDLNSALKNAKTISVTIKSIQVDSVPVALWTDAAAKNVSHSSPVYTMAVDGHHLLMGAAVAVTGMTVTYTLDSSISASVQAQIQANSVVNIGTADKPVKASVDIGNNGQTVTVNAVDRTYVLGQFLKIKKTSTKDQDADFEPNSPTRKTPNSKSFPHVDAKTADTFKTAIN